MTVEHPDRRLAARLLVAAALLAAGITMPAQQMVTDTRDPAQLGYQPAELFVLLPNSSMPGGR